MPLHYGTKLSSQQLLKFALECDTNLSKIHSNLTDDMRSLLALDRAEIALLDVVTKLKKADKERLGTAFTSSPEYRSAKANWEVEASIAYKGSALDQARSNLAEAIMMVVKNVEQGRI